MFSKISPNISSNISSNASSNASFGGALHKKHVIRLFLIIIATLFYFFANFHRVAVPGAIFDVLGDNFHINASKIALLGSIFCYTYAFCQLIIGILVDKIGGFRVIAIGVILFALGSLLFAHSTGLLGLYFSRALLGIGAAAFYLSTIREVKKYSKDKNFSLAVSYILFVGYSGGIFANAPFVALCHNFGLKNSFYIIGYITLILALLYLILFFIFRPCHIEVETKFSLEPFKKVLSNKDNLVLYVFGAINYGLYYVLQSVIGKKFLEDFCFFTIHNAALVLSLMAVVSACAGTISAAISRFLNKRALIFRIYSCLSLISMFLICLTLFFNFHTKLLSIVFFVPSFIGSISPLLILALHRQNDCSISATAVSVQNFSFFMTVGVLGMISGILMGLFKPLETEGGLVYTNKSYLAVFGLFLILSMIEVAFAFKIKDDVLEK